MKVKTSEKAFDALNYFLLILIMIVTVYPLLYVLFASVSNASELMMHRGILYKPFGFQLQSYKLVMENPNIMRSYLNTLLIVGGGVAVNIIMTALGAYFLSRKNVFWKKYIMIFIVLTMFFNGGIVPFYLIVKGIGLRNTLWSIIIPFSISTFNMIIMRTAFMAIPDSMEESAKIDGANDYVVLFKIIIPLAMPVIAVMILYYGVERWNGWFWASVLISDREKFPLQIILREILIQNRTESMSMDLSYNERDSVGETIKYATIIIATLPILCVYPFLQKYFVKGALIGAIKG